MPRGAQLKSPRQKKNIHGRVNYTIQPLIQLTSTPLPVILPEEKPPNHQTYVCNEERQLKKVQILDNVTNELIKYGTV